MNCSNKQTWRVESGWAIQTGEWNLIVNWGTIDGILSCCCCCGWVSDTKRPLAKIGWMSWNWISESQSISHKLLWYSIRDPTPAHRRSTLTDNAETERTFSWAWVECGSILLMRRNSLGNFSLDFARKHTHSTSNTNKEPKFFYYYFCDFFCFYRCDSSPCWYHQWAEVLRKQIVLQSPRRTDHAMTPERAVIRLDFVSLVQITPIYPF